MTWSLAFFQQWTHSSFAPWVIRLGSFQGVFLLYLCFCAVKYAEFTVVPAWHVFVMSFVEACLFSCNHSSAPPELLMFSLPIRYLQRFQHISWTDMFELKRFASIGGAEYCCYAAQFSCVSPHPQSPLCLLRTVWRVSTSHTLLSDLRSDLPLCLCCRELEKQNIIPADLCLCVFSAARVPKHLVPLVSLFLHTSSSFPPLSLVPVFSASLFFQDLVASLRLLYPHRSIPR